MLKSFSLLFSLCVFFLLTRIIPAAAQENPEDASCFSIHADYNSFYVWHGIKFSNIPVIQPGIDINIKNFTISLWGNADSDGLILNEIDPSVSYTKNTDNLSFETTAIVYNYPNSQDLNTGEVILKLSYPSGPYCLFVCGSFDFLLYKGSCFLEAGITYDKELSSALSLSFSGCLGLASAEFNKAYLGSAKNAFNSINANIALNYSLAEGIYITPHLDIALTPDSELQEQAGGRFISNTGITLGKEF